MGSDDLTDLLNDWLGHGVDVSVWFILGLGLTEGTLAWLVLVVDVHWGRGGLEVEVDGSRGGLDVDVGWVGVAAGGSVHIAHSLVGDHGKVARAAVAAVSSSVSSTITSIATVSSAITAVTTVARTATVTTGLDRDGQESGQNDDL